MLLDKLKMEFICSFIFLFFTGMAAVNVYTKAHDILAMSTLIFILYCILTWIAKPISLAQLNPIITLSLIISGHIEFFKGLLYCLTHLVAAVFAGSLVKLCIPGEIISNLPGTILGIPTIEINIMKAILFEILGSFLLVFVYFILLIERNAPKYVSGPGLGAVMFLINLNYFYKTGAGINPAKMIGFSIIANNFDHLYVYIIGPVVGGLLGGLLGMMLLTEKAFAYKVRIKKEKQKKRRLLNLKKKEKLSAE